MDGLIGFNNDITLSMTDESIFHLNQCYLFLSCGLHHLNYRSSVVIKEIYCFLYNLEVSQDILKSLPLALSYKYIMFLAEVLNFVTERFDDVYAFFLVL